MDNATRSTIPTAPPSPRVSGHPTTKTAAEEQLAQLQQKFAEDASQLATLKAKVADFERTARGTTRANAGIARIEAVLKQSQERLTEIEREITRMPVSAQAYESELERIGQDTQSQFESALNQIGTLNTKLRKLTGTVSEHTTRLVMLEEGQKSTDQRLGALEKIRHLATWPIGVGIVIGIIAGLLWWNLFHSVLTTTMPDGSTLTVVNETPRTYGAWMFGVAACCITMAVIYLVLAHRSKRNQNEIEEEEFFHYRMAAVDETTVMPVTHDQDEPSPKDGEPKSAPTRISVIQGAESGAR